MYKVTFDTRKKLILIFSSFLYINCIFCGPVLAENRSRGGEFDYLNDFSERMFLDGATYDTNGRKFHKAGKIVDETLVIKLTPKMLQKKNDSTNRFEVQKRYINKSLAVYQSVRFKSVDNKIDDRVLISQIKYRKINSNNVQPIASAYLDRAPACVTWTKNPDYSPEYYVAYPQHLDIGNENPVGWYQNIWGGKKANRPWKNLNDGNWHTIEMDVFPHEKNGYCIIKVDGIIWQAVTGAPTKSYSKGQKHGDFAARIGIYRDVVDHTHTVHFDDWNIKAYKPEEGPIIPIVLD